MNRIERLTQWANSLTEEQMRPILTELVDFAIDAEMVGFWDDCKAPYWSNSGEPLIEGQQPWPEEDE